MLVLGEADYLLGTCASMVSRVVSRAPSLLCTCTTMVSRVVRPLPPVYTIIRIIRF